MAGQTPSALLESLLRLDVGKRPHAHSLVCSTATLASSPDLSNKQPKPTQFHCTTCYATYTLLRDNTPLKCTSPDGPGLHHLHMEHSAAWGPDREAGLQLRCCRCAYGAYFIKTAPVIPSANMRLIELDHPNLRARIKHYKNFITIVSNLLAGNTTPLKLSNPSVIKLLDGQHDSGRMLFEEIGFEVTNDEFLKPPDIGAAPTSGNGDGGDANTASRSFLHERLEDIRLELLLALYSDLKRASDQYGGSDENATQFIEAHAILLQLLGDDQYQGKTKQGKPKKITSKVVPSSPPLPSYDVLGCTS
ncbi:hypothetical protein SYNPS1DRAFT_28126 [Syncephalis pseudoplumigaleata]|uniref:Uncharacterized protein n=1 Tax=Syncephalis pseudoplumigaleata TaxID=1712513 RepID=A0A4P9Z1C1_9FUNG|nr:hypothetical protein SYNPS1DRAFT_28126 [Syncephalis pseudoplumigaleata]|eukprot:RKP26166.1 hypothetical protein SYNPS1DRAFT_28126 [Syncephalis pseudoplumigaleata]